MCDDATESDWECRELAITRLRHVAKGCADGREVASGMKETIVTTGLRRMERTDEELYLWKQLIDELEKVIYSKNKYGM